MSATEPAPDALDGAAFATTLRAGVHRLYARTDHLNRINVFPVPDGDTGTNLAMTMSAVLGALDAAGTAPGAHAGRVLVAIADAAIDGARGNSGAILAQFLHGVADALADRATIDTQGLAVAAATGARYARDAVTEPREGTLLTVLAAFAAEAQRLVASGTTGIRRLLVDALPGVRGALARTQATLEVLRSANVVDAGAAGFVELVEGMAGFLETGEIGEAGPVPHDTHESMTIGGSEGAHRYCTECMVSREAVDARRLREDLAALGSSLVVAGTRRKARVHIHTNEPAQVFAAAARHGSLSAQKADDMHRQALAAHHTDARRVAIVTDSAADIPDDLLEDLDVQVIPVRVHLGTRSYLDKVTLSPQDFYRALAAGVEQPRTSQPPPGDFRRMYEFLASHYDSVVAITLTARVSGTWAAAQAAAERVAPDKVQVIDSRNVSLGQGLLVRYAAECARAGCDGARVVAATAAMRARTRTFGLLRTLDHAVRGGRVPPLVRTLSRLLRCSPVLTNFADGRIAAGGAIAGRHDLVPRFARYIARRLPAGVPRRIAVGHGDAEADGQALLDALRREIPRLESACLTPLGTALGVHGGPGMLVVGAQPAAPPA
ncbi:MAG: DegV family protein [Steroidobacteraceae bacterium]